MVCFYDDVLIISKTVSEHFRHLEHVLDRMAEYGFEINHLKSQLFRTEVLFLGYLVSGDGIKIDAKKIDDVVHFKTPTCLDDLQKFWASQDF